MVCCDYISTCRWDCTPKYAYGGFLKWGSPKLDGLQWEIQKMMIWGCPKPRSFLAEDHGVFLVPQSESMLGKKGSLKVFSASLR